VKLLYLEMLVRWSGAIVRAGGVLSAPVPLALRLAYASERHKNSVARRPDLSGRYLISIFELSLGITAVALWEHRHG
jgi:hypothetical protein